jgi:glycerol-1-phosphate dehydrogenase [NAD(P)+]
MQALQSSRPASGIEHQFSHCWDMENLCYNGEHVSHGFKVGIGTLASTAILEYLLEQDLENLDVEKCVEAWKSLEEIEEDAKRIFAGSAGHIARALEETRNKYVDKEGLRKQLNALKEAWPTLKEQIRAQIIPYDEVYANLTKKYSISLKDWQNDSGFIDAYKNHAAKLIKLDASLDLTPAPITPLEAAN